MGIVSNRPAWQTPGINPNEEVNFTPVSVIPKKGFFDIVDYSHNNAISQFPKKEQADTERDAYRHLVWLGMMTQKYGAETARKMGELHESKIPFVGSYGQSAPEKEMDLYNNELGIELGSKAKTIPELMEMAKKLVEEKKVKINKSSGSYQ